MYDKEEPLREDRLLAKELVVLEELGFNLSVFDPYTPLQKFLKHAARRDEKDASVLSTAWGLLNDSLCTPLCVLLPPEEIAFAAIRVAVELSERDLEPPVLRKTSFEVNHDDVVLACREMMEHYKFPSSSSSSSIGGAPSPEQNIGNNAGGGGGGGGGGAGGGGAAGGGGGRRQQHLAQHRHEVAAFLTVCTAKEKN